MQIFYTILGVITVLFIITIAFIVGIKYVSTAKEANSITYSPRQQQVMDQRDSFGVRNSGISFDDILLDIMSCKDIGLKE